MKSEAKKLLKLLKNPNLVDLVLFGSSTKGKIRPNDLDIAILYEGSIDKQKIKEAIQNTVLGQIHLQFISLRDYRSFIFTTIIKEGFSVRQQEYIHVLQKIKPVVLFTYSLTSLTPSQKVMFSRALKKFKDCVKLSNRVILVPIETSDQFRDFLQQWSIDLDSQEYGLLPLVRGIN